MCFVLHIQNRLVAQHDMKSSERAIKLELLDLDGGQKCMRTKSSKTITSVVVFSRLIAPLALVAQILFDLTSCGFEASAKIRTIISALNSVKV